MNEVQRPMISQPGYWEKWVVQDAVSDWGPKGSWMQQAGGGSFSGPDKCSRKGNGLLTLFPSFYLLRLLHFYRYRCRGRWCSRRHRGATGAHPVT